MGLQNMDALQRAATQERKEAGRQMQLWLRGFINELRGECGLSWADVSERLSRHGLTISPANLMTKHSRGSFRATEFVHLMVVLGVRRLDLPPALQPVEASPRRINSDAALLSS